VWGRAPHRVRYSVAYDAEEMKFALAELCQEARVRILFHTFAAEPLVEDGRIVALAFQGKSV